VTKAYANGQDSPSPTSGCRRTSLRPRRGGLRSATAAA
jgi:hypothetical protein